MPFAPHPEYSKYAIQWQRCRDTAEGEDAVKARGELYLPRLEGKNNSQTQSKDYVDYKDRASFYGAMGRTVIGLTGAVMRNPAIIEGTPVVKVEGDDIVPGDLEVGFSSETIATMIHSTVSEVLEVGRVGHLIDAPKREDTEGNVKPYVVEYLSEDVITWHERVIQSRKMLALVVLREFVSQPSEDPKKNLEIETSVRYRVLRMVAEQPTSDDPESLFKLNDFDNGAIYVQEIWVEGDGKGDGKATNQKNDMVLVSSVVPRTQLGAPFAEIPFRFTNWDGSSPKVSKPPLIDLASVNISHYRNSADIEHGLHYTALPTPIAAGFDLQGDELEIGSRTAWVADNPEARAYMLEFSGKGLGMLQTKMEAKERQMTVLGARLLEETRPGVEAAETVKLRQSGDRSVLAGITQSISTSWTWILNNMWGWTNVESPPDTITVELNNDFSSAQMSPQMLGQMIAALQTGAISWHTFVENMQRGEIISNKVTAEEEAERVAAGAPSSTLGSTSNNQPFPGAE